MTFRTLAAALLMSLSIAASAFAQSFAVDAHVASSGWSEFDGSDLGIGGRVTWKPAPSFGVDADLTWYPSDFPDGTAFTRSRVEGLFGATLGPRLNRVRPFAKAAAGFLKVGATPGAFACIAIFPPPLNCALAGGDTLPAYEIGGGIEIDAASRAFIRADVSDRILKYPGPSFGSDFKVHDEGFFGHGLRLTVGAGVRF
jgi:hypothetical protein